MLKIWVLTLLSVTIISIISLIGVFTLSFQKEKLHKTLHLMVSLAVGGLFGDVFIHLLPEVYENMGVGLTPALFVLSGVFIFFILERFLLWRHCHVPTSKDHVHPVVALNLIGDGVHNFIDGMLIGASYIVSVPIGMATTLAVILHEIPQEIGDFGILIHGGLPIKKALICNFLSAAFAILGAAISLLLGPYVKGYAINLLPIAAGGFLYIAGSDLIPGLHKDTCSIKINASLWQFVFILLGISIMAALTFLE